MKRNKKQKVCCQSLTTWPDVQLTDLQQCVSRSAIQTKERSSLVRDVLVYCWPSCPANRIAAYLILDLSFPFLSLVFFIYLYTLSVGHPDRTFPPLFLYGMCCIRTYTQHYIAAVRRRKLNTKNNLKGGQLEKFVVMCRGQIGRTQHIPRSVHTQMGISVQYNFLSLRIQVLYKEHTTYMCTFNIYWKKQRKKKNGGNELFRPTNRVVRSLGFNWHPSFPVIGSDVRAYNTKTTFRGEEGGKGRKQEFSILHVHIYFPLSLIRLFLFCCFIFVSFIHFFLVVSFQLSLIFFIRCGVLTQKRGKGDVNEKWQQQQPWNKREKERRRKERKRGIENKMAYNKND